MDAVDYRDNLRASAGRMRWWREADMWRPEEEQEEQEEDEEELVEVLLRGKAPWGFTLRGGSEHREPLLITKVEEGSVAAVCLQAGDELVSVNAVRLSGSRQEVIALVKSSHGTLTLVVRRPKMVDVVSPGTMPSETEVHVARSFLTKILRSSMRKNDPASRPHSWHSSKLTEEEPEPSRTEAPPGPVWQPKHEASRSKESSSAGHRLSSGPGMERLDPPAQPFPSGRLSPVKHPGGAEPLCTPEGKRDSGMSCFGGSSPPVHDSCRSAARKGAGADNIFFKGLQAEGSQQAERPRYLQPGVGPVWQVPEKKKSQSPPPPPAPPPPPPPPLRSDSFAVTKVFPYPDGSRSKGRSAEKLPEPPDQNGLRSHRDRTWEAGRSLLRPGTAADHDHDHDQLLHPGRLFSLSSSDVRQPPRGPPPAHHRQHSDESPLYLQARSAPPAKVQSVGSYYRSLQDLPTNAFGRKQARHLHPNLEGLSRYHGQAGKLQTAEPQSRQGKAEGRWGGSAKSGVKTKYFLPQFQENKETPELAARSRSPEDAAKRAEGASSDVKRLFQGPHHNTEHAAGVSRLQDPWVPQEDHRISPLRTPLLHSLAQESRALAERQQAAVVSTQDAADIGGKSNRRSDRYATTLRNEIQEKRAQLQKSRSAATLTCDAEDDDDEEEAEEWRSTKAAMFSGVSFSNTYKDHLKEAQARVLQATSFQRRDLEPLGPDVPAVKTSNGRVRGRKRFPLAKRTHSFSEPDKIDKVGVEGESQAGSFGERRKFFEAKPAFSRPVMKSAESGKPNERPEQLLLEQQRLGTFAEYQATWSRQKKKTSEARTQGRYHSAENILDADAEEKAACVHERSRSSPSADFYTQNAWRDPHSQQGAHAGRGKSDSSRLRLQPDHGPPPASRPEVPASGAADHRTKPDAANPSPSGPRLPSPVPPQTKGLPPPPRPHLGLQTTSSSQDVPLGARLHEAAQTSPSPASSSPRLGRTPDADDQEEEEEPPRHSSSPPSPLPPGRTAALPLPADRARSPSPQFAPLRLTDEPPAAFVQDEPPLRPEHDVRPPPAPMDPSSPVRKVPVRIVHSETRSERDGRSYLPQSAEAGGPPEPAPPPRGPSLSAAERPASSLFSAYVRQPEPDPAQPRDPGQEHSEEDAKREELARDIMGKDKSLVDILDQSGRMTTMDLMEGLFPSEEQILEGALQRRRASGSRIHTCSPRSSDRREEDDVSLSAAASLVPSSSYYNTSAPKAELLIKMKDMQEQLEEQDSEDELDVDLAGKKQELISSLAGKLEVLREARHSLQEDVEDNEALGRQVEATVQRRCRPNQLDKFRMFVGDLDKVVSLLLSLSGRLARVENALNSLEEDAPPEEKRTLTDKRKLLMRQHEDAKELKENLDRRERLVSGVMEAHLDPESLDDYRHFVKMKSALIIEQRKLEDKIKLGEEQLKCLLDSLPLDQRPPL